MKKKSQIKVLVTDSFGRIEFSRLKLKRILIGLCARFKVSNAVISIAIVDDAEIVKVNKRFLKSSKKTDVISFDLTDEASGQNVFDMVVNGERALREAKSRGHSAQAELMLYIVHGFLHNLGYNDLKPSDAKKMHQLEDEILVEFGYGVTFSQETKGFKGSR